MDSNPDSDSSVRGTEAAPLTTMIPSMNGVPEQRSLESSIMAESGDEPIMVISIGIGAVAIARGGNPLRSQSTWAAQPATLFDT
jgi:hypothetical protein